MSGPDREHASGAKSESRRDAIIAAAEAYRRRAATLGRDDIRQGSDVPPLPPDVAERLRDLATATDDDLRQQFYLIFDTSIARNVFYEAFPIPDPIALELGGLQQRARERTIGRDEHTRQARELLATAYVARRRNGGR